MSRQTISRATFRAVLALCIVGCGKTAPAETPVGVSLEGARPGNGPPVDFSFDSLDARPVNSITTRGRPLVMSFVTVGNIGSQAQVNYLVVMAKKDEGRIGYALVALDPHGQRELVELYARSLNISFPVALSGEEMLTEQGPFGEVPRVPTTVVLDGRGVIRFRADGRVVKSDELRKVLSQL